MKKISTIISLSVLFLLNVTLVSAQAAGPEIVDISQREIRVFNNAKKLHSEAGNTLLTDSLFIPYEKFWNNYVGSKPEFLRWVRKSVYPHLEELNQLNEKLNRKAIVERASATDIFRQASVVYVMFGPGCTDVGKFTDSTLVIDLMHEHASRPEF